MLVTDSLLLDYKRCQRRAHLNTHGAMEERRPERDFLLKLRQESQRHIQEVLTTQFTDYREPETPTTLWQDRARETKTLMAQGVTCIYRGYLSHSLPINFDGEELEPLELLGHPHLLVKVPGRSRWGNWQYRPISIQLGRRPKPEYKILAAFYAQLLAVYQGQLPQKVEIILRRGNAYTVDLLEWLPRFHQTLADCVQTLSQPEEPEIFISRQRCNLCHWYDHCYAIAQEQQHLSLVPGVTPSRYESLQTVGVLTIDSLAQMQTHQVAELMGTAIAEQLQQQALALVEKRAMVKEKKVYPLPRSPVELYFDIEAEPERNLDYLLGVVVVDHGQKTEKFYGFMAKDPEEEGLIWQEFVQLIQTYPSAPIYHFSEYERETIKRLGKLYGTPVKVREEILEQCFDLHHYVVNHVICPVESYSLKSLANWLGFQWRDAQASGDQSVCWYDNWLTTGDRQFLELILRYNEDDCRATWVLKDWLTEFLGGSTIQQTPLTPSKSSSI
ncbi:TM0106 family RecB-like putative nuclease [Synechocystis sp. CS-94]|nr:TM0106 family RecB-like putative nuclease [Synechocystis sp. CS-94]